MRYYYVTTRMANKKTLSSVSENMQVTGIYIMLPVGAPIYITTLEDNSYLLMLKICIIYDPTIPLLLTYLHVQQTWTRLFIDKTVKLAFINRRMDKLW